MNTTDVNQRYLIKEILGGAIPNRGEPTLDWEISSSGKILIGHGPRQAVWLAAGRIGGDQVREELDMGANSVDFTIQGPSSRIQVELNITG